MATLYTNIDSNKRKTVFLVTVFLVLVIGLGWVFSQIYDNTAILVGAVIFSVIMNLIGYYQSDKIALAVNRAHQLDPEQGREIYRLVENLAITAGIPTPKIYIIPSNALNAFATGRDPQHASIALTAGIVQAMDKNELQGVIAHELSHVGNYDIRLQTLIVILVGFITLASDWFLRSLWWRGGRRSNNDMGELGPVLMILAIVFAILSPIAATLIQLAISRKREFLADSAGALLTRYPEGLASALEKIGQMGAQIPTANKATAHLFIASPLRGGGFSKLFDTHPPLAERIAALRKTE